MIGQGVPNLNPPHDKWRCKECDHICNTTELLHAANPFDPTDTVTGCPQCKSIDSMSAACAIEGCNHWGTCGGTHKDGVYRTTCFKHADWMRHD